jgi:uncharacterized protein (DUF4415 family)
MKKTIKSNIPREFKLTRKARVIPRNERREVSPNAMEPRNTKVRVSIYLDLDVLDFFKTRANKPGAMPYQTQINAILRDIVQASAKDKDAVAELRQAKGLIDSALRKIG